MVNDKFKFVLYCQTTTSDFIQQVTFEDCFAEPEGAHSADCVWKCAYKCFEGGKNLAYMILTFLCAIPAALYWGCLFAKVAFTHIWCLTPGLALLEINCGVMKKLFTIIMECLIGPCCATMGLFFSNVKVENK